uniref:Ubiquitin-like domain-containing protein n=1 Tax=Anopheles melas TaxID=34690 RepID=A0A182UJL1_9DIPT
MVLTSPCELMREFSTGDTLRVLLYVQLNRTPSGGSASTSHLTLRVEAESTAQSVLGNIRQRSKLYGDEEDVKNLQFVGLHIREDDELPYEYYYRAMTFHRKMHDTGTLIF